MQETLTAKEDVHFGHCVTEALGSAAQSGGLFITVFLQLFILGDVLVAVFPDGVSGSNGIASRAVTAASRSAQSSSPAAATAASSSECSFFRETISEQRDWIVRD